MIRKAVAIISLLSVAGCGMFQTPIPAQSCFIVEVSSEPEKLSEFDYGRQVVPLIEQFAMLAGLDISESDSSPQYTYADTDRGVRVSLSLAIGVGRAAVALYSDPEAECSLCNEFDRFILEEVSRYFIVIDCDDDEGFSTPVLYGADLRK